MSQFNNPEDGEIARNMSSELIAYGNKHNDPRAKEAKVADEHAKAAGKS